VSITGTRIEVENLRRHRKLTVPLAGTTVLLGHNNVGKSAVMDGLGLLANASRHSPFMFSSYSKFTFQALAHPIGKDISCRVDFRDPSTSTTGRYAISFGATPPPTSYIDVRDEILEVDDEPLFERRSGVAPSGPMAGPIVPDLANSAFFAALAAGRRRLPPHTLSVPPFVDQIGSTFRAIGQYRMVADFIADAGNSSPVSGAFPNVNRKGTGLTALLIYLHEFEPDAFSCITNDLSNAVDGFEGFEFAPAAQPQESEFRVTFRDSRGAIPSPQLSDGTLNLIGLTAVLRSPRQFRFLCLEEPELGLTPKSIQHLVQALAEGPTPIGAAQPQILITTHSPYLVSSLLDHFTAIGRRSDLNIIVISNDPELDRTVAEPLESAADSCGYDPTLELRPEHIAIVMRSLLS